MRSVDPLPFTQVISLRSIVVPTLLALLGACSFDGDGDGGAGGEGGGRGDARSVQSPFPDAGNLPDGQIGSGGGGGGGIDDPGCRHIDVVIAVDDSSSMQEEMTALSTDVFPAFARELGAISGGIDDFRVAVQDACPRPATYHARGEGGACGFASGEPWMLSSEPDLEAKFACVGAIDSAGYACSGENDDEQPASSAAASFEAPALGAGNAGFLRRDALLVVVAITDEDEQPTPSATATEVATRLAAAKDGDMGRMVFLGIGGGSDCTGVYGDANEATQLRAITSEFEAAGRGVWWDLCEGRLEDGLAEALLVIENACDDFELPID